jgi:hypothetical protein
MIHFNLKIRLDTFTSLWGTHRLKFPICTSVIANDGLLPYGSFISGVTLTTYLGRVDESTNISTATPVVGIIDGIPAIVGTDIVSFAVKHPGNTSAWLNKSASLVIQLTLNGGQKTTFYAYPIYIGCKS